MYMPHGLARWLEALAATSPDKEICGFIFEDWTFAQVRNISDTPRSNFYMDSGHQAKVLVGKTKPIGIFHSHPGGTAEPSTTDLLGWPKLGEDEWSRYWIIVRGMVTEWKREDEHSYSSVWELGWGPKEDMAQPFAPRPERVGP